MALNFSNVEPAPDDPAEFVVAQARLARTEDGRLVPETSMDARWFAYPVGARIPLAEARAGGLVVDVPEPVKQTKPADKARRPGGDK